MSYEYPKKVSINKELLNKLNLSMKKRKESRDYAIQQAQDPIVQLKLQAFRKLSEDDRKRYEAQDPDGYSFLLKMQLYSLERRFLDNLKYYSKSCGLESLKNLYTKEPIIKCLYRKYPTLSEIQSKGGIQIKQFTSMFFNLICWGYLEPFMWREPKDIGPIDSKQKSNIISTSNTYVVQKGGSHTYPPYPPPKRLQSWKEIQTVITGNPPVSRRRDVRYDTLPRLTHDQVENIFKILFPGFITNDDAPPRQMSFANQWKVLKSTIELKNHVNTSREMPDGSFVHEFDDQNGAPDSTCSLKHIYNLITGYTSFIQYRTTNNMLDAIIDSRKKLAISKIQSKFRNQPIKKYVKVSNKIKESIRYTNNWKISSKQVEKVIKVFTINQLLAIMVNPYIPYDDTSSRQYILYRDQLRWALRSSFETPFRSINWERFF
jgi:hypothetical protein